MTYLQRFLLLIVLGIALVYQAIANFIYHPEVNNILPSFLALGYIVWIVQEGIKLRKNNKWHKKLRERDERTRQCSMKAGYIAFWFNIIATILAFILIVNTSTPLLSFFNAFVLLPCLSLAVLV
ncbi:hypothetical protein AM501_16200 [Aneurinibacillus migulanus]|uniref:hypothetical protein n=1 Tax=Aneurinibacillus migulanus TaxID=47500 RepID=UPI0005BBEDA4|nr:hypothetical protein [Aneurinibacillus migulanus]KIV51486.1 hypothetical protein TS64_23935 [Aneurinibacillus migulanus]KPD07269.1 hypothetical protein AM501_16200 [Aneurinibacillus migulanus]